MFFQIGHILPNESMQFTVIFAPKNKDNYTSSAYLDVSGKVERLPLVMKGSGRGPSVILNMHTLNINDIFLNATHEYQIVVKNDGKSIST